MDPWRTIILPAVGMRCFNPLHGNRFLHCSRFAPYVYGGVGAIFGGGERDSFTELLASDVKAVTVGFPATHSGSDTRVFGQAGAGLEIRLTPHIGVMSDFSWNVVDGPENNFGMVRSGVTFAF